MTFSADFHEQADINGAGGMLMPPQEDGVLRRLEDQAARAHAAARAAEAEYAALDGRIADAVAASIPEARITSATGLTHAAILAAAGRCVR